MACAHDKHGLHKPRWQAPTAPWVAAAEPGGSRDRPRLQPSTLAACCLLLDVPHQTWTPPGHCLRCAHHPLQRLARCWHGQAPVRAGASLWLLPLEHNGLRCKVSGVRPSLLLRVRCFWSVLASCGGDRRGLLGVARWGPWAQPRPWHPGCPALPRPVWLTSQRSSDGAGEQGPVQGESLGCGTPGGTGCSLWPGAGLSCGPGMEPDTGRRARVGTEYCPQRWARVLSDRSPARVGISYRHPRFTQGKLSQRSCLSEATSSSVNV